jgi:hypothetical protein
MHAGRNIDLIHTYAHACMHSTYIHTNIVMPEHQSSRCRKITIQTYIHNIHTYRPENSIKLVPKNYFTNLHIHTYNMYIEAGKSIKLVQKNYFTNLHIHTYNMYIEAGKSIKLVQKNTMHTTYVYSYMHAYIHTCIYIGQKINPAGSEKYHTYNLRIFIHTYIHTGLNINPAGVDT